MARNSKKSMGLRFENGQTVDKYGRVLETDWDSFEKNRDKGATPAVQSLKVSSNESTSCEEIRIPEEEV